MQSTKKETIVSFDIEENIVYYSSNLRQISVCLHEHLMSKKWTQIINKLIINN